MKIKVDVRTYNKVMVEARKSLGLSQTRLGELVGLSTQEIISVERLRKPSRRVNISKLLEIAVALGIPVDDIFPADYIAMLEREAWPASSVTSDLSISFDQLPSGESLLLDTGMEERFEQKQYAEQLLDRLSEKEKQVLELLSDGHNTDEIAKHFHITYERVRKIVARAQKKARIYDRLSW